jgi:hypothetical protein
MFGNNSYINLVELCMKLVYLNPNHPFSDIFVLCRWDTDYEIYLGNCPEIPLAFFAIFPKLRVFRGRVFDPLLFASSFLQVNACMKKDTNGEVILKSLQFTMQSYPGDNKDSEESLLAWILRTYRPIVPFDPDFFDCITTDPDTITMRLGMATVNILY